MLKCVKLLNVEKEVSGNCSISSWSFKIFTFLVTIKKINKNTKYKIQKSKVAGYGTRESLGREASFIKVEIEVNCLLNFMQDKAKLSSALTLKIKLNIIKIENLIIMLLPRNIIKKK